MCGIVGILGRGPVAEQLVDSLKRLEYRGYDSAGVATLEGDHLERRRAEGKLKNLEARLYAEPLAGHAGIGHTRWATHGKPNEANAHPHATDNVAVVHNGIIENFRELRQMLEKQGAKFSSETDPEAVAHLVNSYLLKGASPQDAVKASLPQLRGAFALAFVFRGHGDLMIGARKGSPLAIGHVDGEMYLGSDAIALAPFTDTISYLEDGDWVVLTREVGGIYDAHGASGDLHLAVRRGRRHAGGAALRQGAGRAYALRRQCPEFDDRARKRDHVADAGRPGNRRRLDQGFHLPVDGAGGDRNRSRQGAGRVVRCRRSKTRSRTGGNPASDVGRACDRTADRKTGPRHRQIQGRALSRPRHQLPVGFGRRAETEGNLLYPRRRLRRRRPQARADRADRREHAGGGDRAVRPGIREDRLQHAGSRRPRRQHYLDDRRQGRGRSDH